MTLTLTKDQFVNNMFTHLTDGGCILLFNAVQEHCSASGYQDCIVDSINIEISQEIDGVKYYDNCPNIIGMGNGIVNINSNFKELLGSPLTLDNIDKCTIDVADFNIYQFLED